MRYGDVQFRLGGESYVIRYGNVAWDSLKRVFGCDTEGQCIIKSHESNDNLLVFLRTGLEWYQPGLAPERVRELYDELPQTGEVALTVAAWDAVTLAMPELLRSETASDPKDAGPKSPKTRTPSAKRR